MLRYIETLQTWNGEEIDGVKHPVNIDTLWSDEELAAIGLERFTMIYEPEPEPDPLTVPLAPSQFHGMVDRLGLTDALYNIIMAMPQPDRGAAYGVVYYASSYNRSNPLFDQLAPALGVTPEQIDAAWVEAQEIG